jgi:ribosomal-protein-alanine N-acetyltransferase
LHVLARPCLTEGSSLALRFEPVSEDKKKSTGFTRKDIPYLFWLLIGLGALFAVFWIASRGNYDAIWLPAALVSSMAILCPLGVLWFRRLKSRSSNTATTILRYLAPNSIERQLYPGPSIPVTFRAYTARDFDSCVAIHDANAPGRFPTDSRPGFLKYLSLSPRGLIVAEHEAAVVGFGGVMSYGGSMHHLVYGIIAPQFHGKGIGSTLTLLRLLKIADDPGLKFAYIHALNSSISFYQRFGFSETARWKGGDSVEHPEAVLCFWSDVFDTIEPVLRERGHLVSGEFVPDESKTHTAEVVDVAGTGKFSVRLVPIEQEKAPEVPKPPTAH